MTLSEYLEKLHDVAYQANRADGGADCAAPWQKAVHATTHVNHALEIVTDVLTGEQYDIFLDCFGDFEGFVAVCYKRGCPVDSAPAPVGGVA